MKKIQLFVLLILLVVILLLPKSAKGDELASATIAVSKEEPVALIAVPPKLKDERVPTYILVVDEFKDAPVMVRIAMAESGMNPLAKNTKSTASGLFQILKGTWSAHRCTGDVFNEKDNIACARKIYDASGTVPWNESKSNWN